VNRLPIPVAVTLGVVAGVLMRWEVMDTLGESQAEAGTVLVNVVGSLLMGLFVKRTWNTRLHTAATIGLCGGLTTFSTFALDAAIYFDATRWVAGLAYVAVTVTGCAAAYLMGRQLSAISA